MTRPSPLAMMQLALAHGNQLRQEAAEWDRRCRDCGGGPLMFQEVIDGRCRECSRKYSPPAVPQGDA